MTMLTACTKMHHPESSQLFQIAGWTMSEHDQRALSRAGGNRGDPGLQLQEDPHFTQGKIAKTPSLPTHSNAVRQQPIPLGRGLNHAADSIISHEVSLTARGSRSSMSLNPKADDLTRESTRVKLEQLRIGQGGHVSPLDDTRFATQSEDEAASVRFELEAARETIHRQIFAINDLKEQLDERMLQPHVARPMVEAGTQTDGSGDSGLCHTSIHSLSRQRSLELEGRKECVSVDSLLSPTQPDLVLDATPPNTLSYSDLTAELKKVYEENAGLREKLEESTKQIALVKEELQMKVNNLMRELEKKRDENRQWREHAESLESKRIAAQQDSDSLREKFRDLYEESERERAVNTQLRQEIGQGKSEAQRLQRQLGYTIAEKTDLQEQLNTTKTQLSEKCRQEVSQQDIIQCLRTQLQELRQKQQQSHDNALQLEVSAQSQRRNLNPLGFSDYRAPFPQLVSHSPTSLDHPRGVPQANDIHFRGLARASVIPQLKAIETKLSSETSAEKDNEVRPVWHVKEEKPTTSKAPENPDKQPQLFAIAQSDSGHDTGDSFKMPSGLAADQYGPLQAWLKKQNMKPAFGGTYATQIDSTPTQHATERTQHLPGSLHPSPGSLHPSPGNLRPLVSLQSNAPTFQTIESIPKSSMGTFQPPVPRMSVGLMNSPHSQASFSPLVDTTRPRAPAPMAEFQPLMMARSVHGGQTEIPSTSYAQQHAQLGMQSPVRSLLSLKPPDRLACAPPVTIQSSTPFSLQTMGASVSERSMVPRYLKCPQCDRKFDSRDITSYREHLEKCLV
ncbi:uncharacterized protein LOC134188170 isoform X2 [Corticium candelabrum]|uniref:uncharacterized protein LOC134188170 isoform X2 n=1 Tax=Corticium candelabrum TaxID=121492 RepID=UPI002E2596D7|nr:uncharacterized protein LOC134188170 isoform X2 [Corticium candelabrum]